MFPCFAAGRINLSSFCFALPFWPPLSAQRACPGVSAALGTRLLGPPELVRFQQPPCEACAATGNSSLCVQGLQDIGEGSRVWIGAWDWMVGLCKPLGLNVSPRQRKRQGPRAMEVPPGAQGRGILDMVPGRAIGLDTGSGTLEE